MTNTNPPPPWVGQAKHELRRAADRALGYLGYDLVRRSTGVPTPPSTLPPDFDEEMSATVRAVGPYTLTPPERIFALCEAVRYVIRAGIEGAFVECGVWRGGSSLAVVRTLLSMGVTDRDIYLFDTFEYMPSPGPEDVDLLGVPAAEYHEQFNSGAAYDPVYDFLPYETVQDLFRQSGYPFERCHFVKGLVEETIPEEAPDKVALLRLDTDYYASTVHELDYLYPRIPSGGVLLIDDYGHFLGCRQAVDEYSARLALKGQHLLLNRIDYSARLALVP
jgi:O-methyltransferase